MSVTSNPIAYKESGIPWVGKIPKHWEILRVKNLFEIGRGRVISQEELDDNGLYPVYSSQTRDNGVLGYIKTYDFDCEQITWTTDGVNAGTVFLRQGKHNCTNVCGTLRAKNKENMVFLTYALQNATPYYKRPDTNGAKIMNNEMAEVLLIYPPLEEQKKIADFLDTKTRQIEEFIDKKQKLIALLEEKKQTLINQCVTQGLDSSTPLKDSGVEWLGQIPTHWEVRKLKHFGKFQNGINIGAEAFGSGSPFVSYGDVYKNSSLPKTIQGLVESSEIDQKLYSVKEGDIFFTRTSETIEEIGMSSVCFQTIPNATFAGFLIRFRPSGNELDKGFSKFYFRSNLHRIFFIRENGLVTRASLSQELLKDLPVLLPPLEEQKAIAEYLDTQITKIDLAISKIKSQINLIKEYKTTLISEAVCGRVEIS